MTGVGGRVGRRIGLGVGRGVGRREGDLTTTGEGVGATMLATGERVGALDIVQVNSSGTEGQSSKQSAGQALHSVPTGWSYSFEKRRR